MRTIKRCSLELNNCKQKCLIDIAKAYADEKQYWLQKFQEISNIHLIKQHRLMRNSAMEYSYRSSYGLQDRMWKLALVDAAETMDKYWKAAFERIKPLILKNSNISKEQKHYCFWILLNYERFQNLLQHRYPSFKEFSPAEIKQAGNYLNRVIDRHRGKYPKVKISRSFLLDSSCYNIFEKNGRQYISVMTLKKRKRIVLPLLGHTEISGNLRIVLSGIKKIKVHYSSDIKIKINNSEIIDAIDFGYTEAFVDTKGNKYGEQFGQIMSNASDKLKSKMKKRHKLHALSKNTVNCKKAKNIRKFNLGRQKLEKTNQKTKDTIEHEINTAFNNYYEERKPATVITEDLSHVFKFNIGRNWNRRLSAWTKGKLEERIKFKALAKCFCHKHVNPAYSSQMCPDCGYVRKDNRNGDKFKCLFCGYEDYADRAGALNLLARNDDHEITLYMPYSEVKSILLNRFHHRLESSKEGTVTGRTLETVNLSILTENKETISSLKLGGQSKSETINLCPHLRT